jgi:outer membrane lipoprotein-sorting protein
MFKAVLIASIFVSLALSSSFNFNEVRYSDAIERSIEFSGKITFLKDGLFIAYKDINKSLKYSADSLVYMQDNQVLKLDEQETQKITEYFNVLMLLHGNNEDLLSTQFFIEKLQDKSILKPKGDLGKFIERIELVKIENMLKEVKIFLKNNDTIKISIHDEIH